MSNNVSGPITNQFKEFSGLDEKSRKGYKADLLLAADVLRLFNFGGI
jgi:hypothetical protein